MTATSGGMADGPDTPEVVFITRGGPIFRLERRLRLTSSEGPAGKRLILGVVLLAWLPVVLLALLDRQAWALLGMRTEIHVRLLLIVPVLLIGEDVLGAQAAAAMRALLQSGVLAASSLQAWRDSLARVRRWRDSNWPEWLHVGVIYGVTALMLLGALPSDVLRWAAPAIHLAPDVTNRSAAWWWYILVGQPILLDMVLRWLWHWVLWSVVLFKLRRMPLQLHAGHTDGAGGLAFLATPIWAFGFFGFASGAAIAAVWFDEIGAGRAQPAMFANLFVGFLVSMLVLAGAPYLSLTGVLVRARLQGMRSYGALMSHQLERFEARWIARRGVTPTGGDPAEFSAMTDLGSVVSTTRAMRTTVFGMGEMKRLLGWALIPFLPIIFVYAVPFGELVLGVVRGFLGV